MYRQMTDIGPQQVYCSSDTYNSTNFDPAIKEGLSQITFLLVSISFKF